MNYQTIKRNGTLVSVVLLIIVLAVVFSREGLFNTTTSGDDHAQESAIERENAVALVNGEPITREEFDELVKKLIEYESENTEVSFESLSQEGKKEFMMGVLNHMIDELIYTQFVNSLPVQATTEDLKEEMPERFENLSGKELEQQLTQARLEKYISTLPVDEDEFEERYNMFLDRFADESELQDFLTRQNLTHDDIRKGIESDLRINASFQIPERINDFREASTIEIFL